MFGVLFIVTFVFFAMVFLSFTGNTATPTPTIGPTPGANITPTPTRRPSPTLTRRITPTGCRRGTTWASTGAATNITATSATLHGSFSYEWEVFYGWFEYWETADPSTRKSTTHVSYLNYALNVSVTIYNIKTEYSVYLSSQNGFGGRRRTIIHHFSGNGDPDLGSHITYRYVPANADSDPVIGNDYDAHRGPKTDTYKTGHSYNSPQRS
jgi:hypothetical protein